MKEWNKERKKGNTITEVMKMRKNDNKQRKSLLFSTGIVVAGCLVTGLYVNQTMNSAEDYKLDLSQLDTAENFDSELVSDAGAARVNGSDVVNPETVLSREETDKAGNTTKGSGNEVTGKNSSGSSTEHGTDDSDSRSDEAISAEDSGESEELQESGESQKTEESQKSDDAGTASASSSSVVNGGTAALSFSPEDGMTWPVIGDVILNYSMDGAVYFSTLEQYKYNPAIFIGAKQGDTVSACAKGKVTKIGQDNEIGTYVTLSLGNGYEVTCGQLEGLQVQEGDIVARGQVIGTVAKTTKYYAVEGDHVYLKITKDGEPVNPLELLQ